MISKFAVSKFLSRELDSFKWMKKLKRRQLMQAINELDPRPVFSGPFKPYKHQLVGFLIGVHLPQFLYLLDLGVGKTRIILDILSYRKLCGEDVRCLVLVPYEVSVASWMTEVELYAPTLKAAPVIGSRKRKLSLFNRKANLFIISYAGFSALCSKFEVVKKDGRIVRTKKKRLKKRKRKLDNKKVREFSKLFDSIALDESTKIMNQRSLTYKICNQLSKRIELRYALTGTPFGRNPQALWSQFYFIDRGETLGQTLGLFRTAFFSKSKNYWGGYDYTFNKKKEKKLHRVLNNRSIFYAADECVDLPPKVLIPKYANLTEEMRPYYGQLQEQIRLAKGNFRVMKNSFLNMRQITSGFIGLIDDETGERAQIEFSENPKMDLLLSLIDELPENAKLLVFHEFTWTGNKISSILKERGILHERLWSGQKAPAAALHRFQKRPEYPIFLINNNSGAFNLNLQMSNYTAYYESPVDPIIRVQTEGRTRRSGQKSNFCFYADLILRDTVDEKIQGFLAEGEDLFKAVVAGKMRL